MTTNRLIGLAPVAANYCDPVFHTKHTNTRAQRETTVVAGCRYCIGFAVVLRAEKSNLF